MVVKVSATGYKNIKIESEVCEGYPIAFASSKILETCSNYHKTAGLKYLEAREMCKAKANFFKQVYVHHYDNDMKFRDDKSCEVVDGPTTHYCACV